MSAPLAGPQDPLVLRRARRIAALGRGCAVLALAVAALVLALGWGIGFDRITRVLPGFPAMVPGTAGSILVLALVALIPRAGGALWLWLGRLGALVVGLFCLWVLSHYLGLFGKQPPTGDRTSPATAMGLILVALVALSRAHPRAQGLLASFGVVLAMIALEGYLFSVQSLYAIYLFNGLAVHTTLCLMLLFLAYLLPRCDQNWLALLLGEGPGGRSARLILPVAVVAPVGLSWGALSATDLGLINSDMRLSGLSILLGVAGVFVVLRNSQRLDAQAQAEQMSLARLRRVLNGIDTAVFVSRPRGEHEAQGSAQSQAGLLTNLRAETLSQGQPRNWLSEGRFYRLADRAPLPAAEMPFARLLEPEGSKAQGAQRLFLGYLDPQQREHALNFRMAPIEDGTRVLTVTDETEGWMLRENLARSEKLDAIGQLSGGVAHEISNILGVIQLSADTGALKSQDPVVARHLEAIQRACVRGTDLTRRLLSLTREPAAGGARIDALALIADSAELARHALPPMLELQCDLPGAPLYLRANPADLETVVLNLVLNARNAMLEAQRDHGRITLRLWAQAGRLHLSVADDGPGMAPAVLEHATEPFFTTRRGHGGSGLGLAMIANVADRLGGQFHIRSQLGKGTEAELELPLAPEGIDGADPAEALTLDLSGQTILLVEDDPQLLALTGDTLRFLGAELFSADTGEAALEILQREPVIDLLMSDVILKGALNGFALAEAAHALRPGLKVLYMSGYTEALARADRKVPGILLRKPVSLSMLQNALSLTLKG